MEDLIKVGLPSILGIFSTLYAYRVGRQTRIDEIRIKRGYELAEQLATLFLTIQDHYEDFYSFYEGNFSHIESVSRAMDYFERYTLLYQSEHSRLKTLHEERGKLWSLLKLSRPYIKADLLDNIEEFIRLGQFTFHHDGGIFINTYAEEFFKNVFDEKKHDKRAKLAATIRKQLASAVL